MAKSNETPNKAPSTFTLLLAYRDAQSTRGGRRALPNALVLRTNSNESYICWPRFRRLAEDTQLDQRTLKRAAKALEEAGLIRRVTRRHRSNQFYVRFDVLLRQAASKSDAKKLAKEEVLRKLKDGEEIIPIVSSEDDDPEQEPYGAWDQETTNDQSGR